jgi:hypothetical protein
MDATNTRGMLRPTRSADREGDMITGVGMLGVALAFFVLIWLVVLWGSRYFGPADH